MKVLGSPKVSSIYMVTVPIDVRKHLKVKKGDRLTFLQCEDGEVIVRKEMK